ncbi:hypothetical protein PR048_030804 [Dryococelus australis]|uniref:Uncharacterized protein n=1 Tax=Dryococelus australis TaxID=614101 RepID=A0ABQ9GCM1_9NEOP|nr:hypothetical protein PR048_030804 [Dryococelus australis]
MGGRGGVVDRLLASHLGEPGSFLSGVSPGFSHVIIVSGDAAGQRVFSGISRYSDEMSRMREIYPTATCGYLKKTAASMTSFHQVIAWSIVLLQRFGENLIEPQPRGGNNKLDFEHMYVSVTFAIASQLAIRHVQVNFGSITDLHGNKQRILCPLVCDTTSYLVGQQPMNRKLIRSVRTYYFNILARHLTYDLETPRQPSISLFAADMCGSLTQSGRVCCTLEPPLSSQEPPRHMYPAYKFQEEASPDGNWLSGHVTGDNHAAALSWDRRLPAVNCFAGSHAARSRRTAAPRIRSRHLATFKIFHRSKILQVGAKALGVSNPPPPPNPWEGHPRSSLKGRKGDQQLLRSGQSRRSLRNAAPSSKSRKEEMISQQQHLHSQYCNKHDILVQLLRRLPWLRRKPPAPPPPWAQVVVSVANIIPAFARSLIVSGVDHGSLPTMRQTSSQHFDDRWRALMDLLPLACSPPTKAIRVQSPAGSLHIFACGNRTGRCRWSAGFLGDLLFPLPFHFGHAPYSPQSPSSAFKTSMQKHLWKLNGGWSLLKTAADYSSHRFPPFGTCTRFTPSPASHTSELITPQLKYGIASALEECSSSERNAQILTRRAQVGVVWHALSAFGVRAFSCAGEIKRELVRYREREKEMGEGPLLGRPQVVNNSPSQSKQHQYLPPEAPECLGRGLCPVVSDIVHSRVLQAPSRTVDFTRRFHTLASIQATNTSLAVVPQSPVVVHTSLLSRTLGQTASVKDCQPLGCGVLRPPPRIFPNSRDASRRAEEPASLTRTFLRRCQTRRNLQQGKGAMTQVRRAEQRDSPTGRCPLFTGFPGRGRERVGLRLRRGAAESAPAASRQSWSRNNPTNPTRQPQHDKIRVAVSENQGHSEVSPTKSQPRQPDKSRVISLAAQNQSPSINTELRFCHHSHSRRRVYNARFERCLKAVRDKHSTRVTSGNHGKPKLGLSDQCSNPGLPKCEPEVYHPYSIQTSQEYLTDATLGHSGHPRTSKIRKRVVIGISVSMKLREKSERERELGRNEEVALVRVIITKPGIKCSDENVTGDVTSDPPPLTSSTPPPPRKTYLYRRSEFSKGISIWRRLRAAGGAERSKRPAGRVRRRRREAGGGSKKGLCGELPRSSLSCPPLCVWWTDVCPMVLRVKLCRMGFSPPPQAHNCLDNASFPTSLFAGQALEKKGGSRGERVFVEFAPELRSQKVKQRLGHWGKLLLEENRVRVVFGGWEEVSLGVSYH